MGRERQTHLSLADALFTPVQQRVAVAFVYGSIAKGEESVHSDIDLLVLTDTLPYPDLIERLQEAEDLLGRPVNPILMGVAEWQAKRREPDSFGPPGSSGTQAPDHGIRR